MKKLKSMIPLLLTLVLIFCMMPTPAALAAETAGEVTEEETMIPVAEETDPIETSEDSSSAVFSAKASYAQGKYAQRAVVWTWNGESLKYTYEGKTHDSDYLIMHEVWNNGEWNVAYCIQPGVNIVSSSVYDSETFNGDTLWGYLDPAVQRSVSLALLYGYPNSLDSDDLSATVAYQVATYMIIHELILGWRETTYPYAQLDDSFYDVFGGGTAEKPEKLEVTSIYYSDLNGTFLDREDIAYAYEFIGEKLRKHDLLPSFASSFRNQAPTYTMTPNNDGTYSVTLTDTNGILSEFDFTNTEDLTFTKSSDGKSVTITTSNPNIGTATVTSTKTVPSSANSAYLIWTADTGSQALVTVKTAAEDPVPAYFKVTVPIGSCKIVKESTNGGSVAGWHFEVKDASENVVGNYVTDSTGIITLDLEPGTYTVTETDGAYKYWVNDATPTKTVTVKAGETATVTFTNQWRGQTQIIKTATNGGSVAGWHFEVKDSSGNVVGNYVTDSTGIITLDLEPGTYTVTETDGEYEYWHNDPTPVRTVTVKAGETAKVTFQNQWVGKAKIVKATTNGGTVEGWTFTIKDADGKIVGNYTTDSTGTILVNLEPGTYTVQETDRNDPYWYCDTEPKTVTVKAGETATVTFRNEWIGKAKIIKTLANPEAGSVEGWTFTIHKVVTAGTAISAEYLTTVTTGADGTILQDLEPGEYIITEVLEDDSLWECVTEKSQTVIVEAGSTTEVSFTNALRPGEIRIQKVDTQGEPLDGVEFLLEWSEDGINWSPVTFTDSAVPQIGGCTTEGLTDGKLVTGKDGYIEFSGLYPLLQYRLTETETKDGYQLLAGYAYEGGLSVENDLTVSITVVNAEIFTLPKTGSKSLVLMPLSILLCLGICAGAIMYLRKKED